MTAPNIPRWFNSILIGLCAALMMVLLGVVKWHGDRIYEKVDELDKAVRALERYQEGSEGDQEYIEKRTEEHAHDIERLEDRVRALERNR